MKEKSPERELLPNLRPNTEDFLTFLCFRGTNALPKELDFQKSLNQASTSATSAKAAKSSPDKKNKDSKAEVKKKSASKKSETVTSAKVNEGAKSSATQETTGKDPKTGFMPFAVRKRAEVHPPKRDNKKLQTIAKKKQQSDEANSSHNEFPNGSRATRANLVDDKPSNDSGKKGNKRKTATADTSTESSGTPEKSHKKNLKSDQSVDKAKSFSDSFKSDAKSGAKKKAQAKENDKRQTRLSAVKNPSSSTPNDIVKNGKESPEFHKYFSSDDDEPLVKSEPQNKKAKIQNSSKAVNLNSEADDSTTKNETTTSIKQNNSQPPEKAKRGRKKKEVAVVEQEKPKEKVVLREPENSTEKKKVERKKKINVDQEIANSQTDLSENETRGRPMRKTKEAATIYMELIGRKLTLQDSSDNDSSLDSLEVPNLKKVEMMENELKAVCEKAKEAKAEKKKQDDKKVS